MWENLYRQSLSKLLKMYLRTELTEEDLWVILDSLLPRIIDMSGHEMNELDRLKDLYRIAGSINPEFPEDRNYLKREEVRESVGRFIEGKYLESENKK